MVEHTTVELYQHRAGAVKSTRAAEPEGGGDDDGQILLCVGHS